MSTTIIDALIVTQATDAKGIAIDFGSAINDVAFSGQSNSGQR